MGSTEIVYAVSALAFQTVLVVHFAVRLISLDIAVRLGWIVYALSIPAAGVGIALLVAGADWSFAVAGLLFLVWATFGFVVEYVLRISWRSPIRWGVFVPYVVLYLATAMFYWWPLASISRVLWFTAGGLFVVATALNVASHRRVRR